jgi:hypothetical protein
MLTARLKGLRNREFLVGGLVLRPLACGHAPERPALRRLRFPEPASETPRDHRPTDGPLGSRLARRPAEVFWDCAWRIANFVSDSRDGARLRGSCVRDLAVVHRHPISIVYRNSVSHVRGSGVACCDLDHRPSEGLHDADGLSGRDSREIGVFGLFS